MALVIFYVPCPDADEAKKLITHLLSDRLIACGNIVESKSVYNWADSVVHENEWIAIMKSLTELSGVLENSIKKIHPYKTPAILSWSVSCNAEYLEWVRQQVLDV